MSAVIATGPVRLELNALLTVSGTLTVDRTGTLTYEPGLDARIMGKDKFQVPLFSIKSVSRVDGGRRVVVALAEGNGDGKQLDDLSGNLVLRGGMAQQAYVILRAMLEWLDNPGTPMPRFFPAIAYGRLWHAPGILAVGPLGMGFGSSADNLLTGALSTAWISITEVQKIRAEYPGIHIDSGDTLSLECEWPLVVRDLLIERWFRLQQIKLAESRVLTETPDGPRDLGPWQKEAVRWSGLDANMGLLEIAEEGLVFHPVVRVEGDVPELLLPRRRAGELFIDEPEPVEEQEEAAGIEATLSSRDQNDTPAPSKFVPGRHRFYGHDGTLVVGLEENHLARITVSEPSHCLDMLEELISSAEWFPQVAHEDPKLGVVTGPSAYTSVWHGHVLLATRAKVAVAPFSGKLLLKLDGMSEPPSIPTGVRVEIANSKNRYLLTGLLSDWVVPDPRRARPGSLNERTLTILLEDEVISANRREHYRLPVPEKLPRIQLQPPPPKGRATFPMPTEVENGALVDLSRKGASVLLPIRPELHTLVSFLIATETEKEKQDKKKLRGKRQVEEEKEAERARGQKQVQDNARKEAMLQDRQRRIQMLDEIQSETGEEKVLDLSKVGLIESLIPEITDEGINPALPEEAEPDTEEHFLIRGRVVYAYEVKLSKDGPSQWKCGLAVYDDCDGNLAFVARQRAFLKHRSEERQARGL